MRRGDADLLAVVVELEEGGTTFNLGLDHAGRGDLEETELLVGLSEAASNGGADLESGAGDITTENEMSVVELGDVVGVGSHNVGDGLLTTGRLANDLVVVDNKLMTTRGVVSLGHRLDHTKQRERGLVGKSHSIVGLGKLVGKNTLQEPRTITERNEQHVLLLTRTMHPTRDRNANPTVLSALLDLDLLRRSQARVLLENNGLRGLELSITSSLDGGLLGLNFGTLGLLLDRGLVGAGNLLQGRFGSGLPFGTGLLGGSGDGLAGLVLGGGLGGDVGGVRGKEGLEGEILGAGGFGGVDSGVFVDVDD